MTDPLWYDPSLDLGREGYAGPFALHIHVGDAAAEAIMARATLDEQDLQDFAGRSDALFRIARRRLTKALLAWASGVHPQEICILRSPLGAPVVREPEGWHVSVSGRAGECLIGIAPCPIGVDMEPAGAPPPPLDMLTPAERDYVRALPDAKGARAALSIWVAKEAHGKRIGLASQLDTMDIEVSGAQVRSPGHRSICATAFFDDKVGAVALGDPPDR